MIFRLFSALLLFRLPRTGVPHLFAVPRLSARLAPCSPHFLQNNEQVLHGCLRVLFLSGLFTSLVAGCGPHKPSVSPIATLKTAATRETPSVRFSDDTQRAGLAFVQSDGSCGMRYFVEQVAAGACLIDVANRGVLDIYFPQPKSLGVCTAKSPQKLTHRLYRNDGKGHFTLDAHAFRGVETDYGISAAAGDYDNDGFPDLYVCCYGQNKLFHNNRDGTFTDVTEKAGVGLKGFSTGAVWFDYDGDGLLDLFVCRYCEWSVATDIACPGPDGKRDVCLPQTYTPATDVLYHNNGDGTFTNVTLKAGLGSERRRSLGAAAVDFDNDGRLDLFVANDMGPNFLFHNLGNGKFKDEANERSVAYGNTSKPLANMGVAVGDYNEDGKLDVLVTTFANEEKALYRNEGDYFTDVSAAAGIAQPTLLTLGFGTGFLDTRNLGRLDLFVANGHVSPYVHDSSPQQTYKQRNQLLLNDGLGHFTESLEGLPKEDVRVHRGALFGDLDNDGRVDVLVTAQNDRPTYLHNDSPLANWLMLKLTDRHGCSTPVGTRCVATIGGKKRLRVVLGGGSYGGSSDYRVHFGLGDATQVDLLEIQWMDGKRQSLTNLAANRIVNLKEAP